MTASQSDIHVMLTAGSIALPLLIAVLSLAGPMRRFSAFSVPFAALPALGLALSAFVPGDSGPILRLPLLITGVTLGLDGTSRIFLLFTSLLWGVAGLYGLTYLEDDKRRHWFFFFYLLSFTGNVGLILAQDMVAFYLFFALMTFAAYGLVIHTNSPEARYAAKIYIAMAVIGESLIIAALLFAASAAGGSTALRDIPAAVASSQNRHSIIALVLLGFGVKAGAVPLHLWLPLAHPVAPTPASAVLSGAMIKAGLLAWLRFLPLGAVSLPDWGLFCIIAGLGGAFYGVVIGLTQHDPKTILAYSSISQMGFMIFGTGIGLINAEAWPAALSVILLYAFHHSLSKGALFLGTGIAASVISGTGRLLVNGGLLLPALALAGAPFTSGAIAKSALKEAYHLLPLSWHSPLQWVFLFAAMGTTLLMGRFLFMLNKQSRAGSGHGAKAGLWAPWAVLLLFVAAAVPILPLEDFHYAVKKSLSGPALAAALWPVLAGVFLILIAVKESRINQIGEKIRIPSGDLLALIIPALDHARVLIRGTMLLFAGQWSRISAVLIRSGVPDSGRITRIENRFANWFIAGLLFLTLAAMLYILMLP